MTPPGGRFGALLGAAVLSLCASYAAAVLWAAPWAEITTLNEIFPFYGEPVRAFPATTWQAWRWALSAAAGLLAVGLLRTLVGGSESRALMWETALAGRGLRRGLRELSGRQRWQAGAALALLTGLRLYFSLANPEYDDAVSYEVFVSKGLLATSAYYPIPNNHVLSNTISLLFYQIHPGFWWSMRLPVLLMSTGATVLWFAALRRRVSFEVAGLATGLFSCLQLSLYHAGVGRGYWLLIGLAGIVFFATLELTEAVSRRPRAAWAGLVLAGVLGCYTVPPFVYVLASAFSWLGLVFLRRRHWPVLRQLLAAGAISGAGILLLYTPLLLVSGLKQLSGNGYVAQLAPSVFWPELPAYIWHTEGFLAGQRTLGTLITLPVLGLLGWLFYLARTGRLPAGLARQLQRLGVPALWFMGMPYLVILGQRVFPPERVLLYKAMFFFVLVGLVVEGVLAVLRGRPRQWFRRGLAVALGLFVLYETYSVMRVNPVARGSNAAYYAGLHWLAAQPAGPVLIPRTSLNLFFRFYAHTTARHRPWHIDFTPRPGTHYRYVVVSPLAPGLRPPFEPAYRSWQLEIYALPSGFLLDSPAWQP